MVNQKRKKNGFTIIELVVVIVIVSVLSSIIVPNFISWRASMHVKAVATDLFSCIQETRMIAINTNSAMAIVFDTANNRYYRCDDSGVDGWSGVDDNIGAGDNNIVQTYYLASDQGGVQYGHGIITGNNSVRGTAFPVGDISYTNHVLIINSQGIGTGGYVYLENRDGDKIFAVGTLTSGLVRIVKWIGGSWQ